jgi:hypothetical protein
MQIIVHWIEFTTPGYNWTGQDGTANLAWSKSFADPTHELYPGGAG